MCLTPSAGWIGFAPADGTGTANFSFTMPSIGSCISISSQVLSVSVPPPPPWNFRFSNTMTQWTFI